MHLLGGDFSTIVKLAPALQVSNPIFQELFKIAIREKSKGRARQVLAGHALVDSLVSIASGRLGSAEQGFDLVTERNHVREHAIQLLGSELVLEPADGGPQVVQLDSDRLVHAVLGDLQGMMGADGQDA